MTATEIGSFTSPGNSDSVRGDQVDVLISGTFSAALQLQAEDINGNWIDVPDHGHSAPVFAIAGCAVPRNWRLACAAHTSGEAVYELSAASTANRR